MNVRVLAQTYCGAVEEKLAAFPVNRDTFIVIVTRGHQQDSLALRVCMRRPVAYVGMIGSRRKVAILFKSLLDQGFPQAAIDRVHAPIGLAIGAETPEEIAVSIVAELIGVRAGVAAK